MRARDRRGHFGTAGNHPEVQDETPPVLAARYVRGHVGTLRHPSGTVCGRPEFGDLDWGREGGRVHPEVSAELVPPVERGRAALRPQRHQRGPLLRRRAPRAVRESQAAGGEPHHVCSLPGRIPLQGRLLRPRHKGCALICAPLRVPAAGRPGRHPRQQELLPSRQRDLCVEQEGLGPPRPHEHGGGQDGCVLLRRTGAALPLCPRGRKHGASPEEGSHLLRRLEPGLRRLLRCVWVHAVVCHALQLQV